MAEESVDYLVVGGGFYGCCLALYLRSVSKRVMLVEVRQSLLTRASRVNQARIHTGFHYPRSALTAVKSMVLHRHFARDFPEATIDGFQMLYAIARRHSKISTKRFFRMFRDMGAPIAHASAQQCALFDPKMVEGVFACHEAAFDSGVLRALMQERLKTAHVDVRVGTSVTAIADDAEGVEVQLSTGRTVRARYVFNTTYAELNRVLNTARLPSAPLKFELAEVALVHPPDALRDIGVTVMDGPFFSLMPYPEAGLHSLTHVHYTPHASWSDPARDPRSGNAYDPQSRFRYMLMSGKRYLPSLDTVRYEKSLFEVKTVLALNEADDGRPILFQRAPAQSRVISILGGKIDNIYDLFSLLKRAEPEFSTADGTFLLGRA